MDLNDWGIWFYHIHLTTIAEVFATSWVIHNQVRRYLQNTVTGVGGLTSV